MESEKNRNNKTKMDNKKRKCTTYATVKWCRGERENTA